MLTMKRFLIGFGVIIFISAIAAAYTSMQYWGYLFSPPPVENVLSPMTHIESYSHVFMSYNAEGYLHLSPHHFENNYRAEPYFRIKPHLEAQNVASSYNMEAHLRAANIIGYVGWQIFPVESRELCTPWCQPAGFVVKGYNEEGIPLLFINVASTNAVYGTDDHYHYYEGLFEAQPDGQFLLVREQTYQFDVAGMEGLTFPFIFIAYMIVFSAGTILIIAPTAAIYTIRQRFIKPKQKRKSHLVG